jgi:hypothetical protein
VGAFWILYMYVGVHFIFLAALASFLFLALKGRFSVRGVKKRHNKKKSMSKALNQKMEMFFFSSSFS